MFWENVEFLEHLQKQDVHTWFVEDIPDIPGTCTAFLHVIGLFYFRYSAMCTSCRCSEIPHYPGTFTWTLVFFFLGFLHTTSCRCSGFSRDMYPDTGIVCFRFLYSLQMLWKFRIFLGHLPGHGGCFLGLSEHYIMQMLQFFLGHLPGHQRCFLSGFPHSPGTCDSFLHVCNIFIWDIDPWNYLCTSWRCSGFSWDI